MHVPIFSLKHPLYMSVTAYPIELKIIKTSQEVGNELSWHRQNIPDKCF